MKKINHWINGKNVAGADYFHTTNPATGEVLAEVASGGEAEINRAVAAAKEAFPKWANLPMKERARLMRRTGILSIRTSGDRGDGNRRYRPADPPDQKRVDPARLTQFRIFRRSMPADERQDLSGRRQDAELHPRAAGWRLRAGVAVERAVYDRHGRWRRAWRWGIPRC